MIRNLRYSHFLVMAAIVLIGLVTLTIPVAADTPYAWFDVSSNPSGAWACIDSYDCHDTPITWTVDASSYHRITVYKDGYRTWTDYVGTGSERTTTMVNADLVPIPVSAGWLDVNSNGEEIWIDGIYYGNGAKGVSLSPGSHNLELQKAGYYDYKSSFSVTAGQTTTLSPGMTPYTQLSGFGDLQIQSDPVGAAVFVNNNYEGTTTSSSPLYVTQLTPGSYSVRITLPDYRSYTETADVQEGIKNDIWATLLPATPGPTPDTTGQITVGSTPAGASIYLDNAFRGLAPLTLADIPSGSHTIILKMQGYRDWTSSVNVAGGSYTQVSGTLSSGQEPDPTATAPTRSPLGGLVVITALGICGLALLHKKRS